MDETIHFHDISHPLKNISKSKMQIQIWKLNSNKHYLCVQEYFYPVVKGQCPLRLIHDELSFLCISVNMLAIVTEVRKQK